MYKIPAKTLFIGKNLIYVPQCHSTNDVAAKLGNKDTEAEGAVVITDHQTAGRGQHGNTWLAEPGMNLTFSVIFKPTFLVPKDHFHLNMAISLAIRDGLSQTLGKSVFIKWPNDLVVLNKKITGILIENQLLGPRITRSVAGVGVNVNQRSFPFPAATSIRLINNEPCELPGLFETLLEKIEFRYLQLKSGRIPSLTEEYLSYLYWINELHLFESAGSRFEGVITGVDEAGRLQIKVQSEIKSFQIKQITFIQ